MDFNREYTLQEIVQAGVDKFEQVETPIKFISEMKMGSTTIRRLWKKIGEDRYKIIGTLTKQPKDA